MEYQQLKKAIENNIPLVWNDPEPIEGNDYSITQIVDFPDEEFDDEFFEDFILTIQYGAGSEAEVLPNEIDFATIVTDPSCNQTCRQIDVNVWEFEEDRVVNPETGETERFSDTIDLSEYTQGEMFESVQPFGYSFHEMCDWIDNGSPNIQLIAECIFEMS